MDLGLSGKVAVVTGGSEGIGRASAHSLGREGASVVVCARRKDVLERGAADVAEDTGAPIVPSIADATEPADVQRLLHDTLPRVGWLTSPDIHPGARPPDPSD